MREKTLFLAIGIVMVCAGGAAAHDGHVHKIMGTVTARDAKHIEVKTPSGENLSVAITPKTTATRDKRKVSRCRRCRSADAWWSPSATVRIR